jgi:hypothetical protein
LVYIAPCKTTECCRHEKNVIALENSTFSYVVDKEYWQKIDEINNTIDQERHLDRYWQKTKNKDH